MTNKRAQKTMRAVKEVHKQPAKDFKKLKAKVGKKAPAAASATNVSFTAKSVSVPTQGILAEKSEFVTKRRLGMTELMEQCQHYSPSVRKDAYAGLKELLTMHPSLLIPNFTILIHGVVGGMVDVDKLVRIALLSLLEHMLLSLPEEHKLHIASASVPLLVSYISSAMSHIEKPIRKDSIKFLDEILKHLTPLVWKEAHIKQLLPNLQSIFTDRAAMNLLTPASATSQDSKHSNKAKKSASTKHFEAALRCLRALGELILQQTASLSKSATTLLSTDTSSAAAAPSSHPSSINARLASSLNDLITTSSTASMDCERWAFSMVSLLVECWLEVQAEPGMPLAKPILQCIEVLLRVVSQEQLVQFMAQFANFVFPVFDAGGNNRNFERDFLFCRIMSLFLPVADQLTRTPTAGGGGGGGGGSTHGKRQKLTHVPTTTPNEAKTIAQDVSLRLVSYISDSFGHHSPATAQLLPIIESMLPRLSQTQLQGVMEAFTAYYLSLQSPKAQTKAMCLDFMFTLLTPPAKITSLLTSALSKSWVKSVIGDLSAGNQSEITIGKLVKLLGLCLRHYTREISAELKLAPRAFESLFHSEMFGQMPLDVQVEAIQSLFFLRELDDALLKSLVGCICDKDDHHFTPAVKCELVEIVTVSFSRAAKLSLPSFLSFLLSSARCKQVLPTVCRCLRAPSKLAPDQLLDAIAPQLQHILLATTTATTTTTATVATPARKTNVTLASYDILTVLRLVEACLPFWQLSQALTALFEALTNPLLEFFLQQFNDKNNDDDNKDSAKETQEQQQQENVKLVLSLFVQIPAPLLRNFLVCATQHITHDSRIAPGLLVVVKCRALRQRLLELGELMQNIPLSSASASSADTVEQLRSEFFVMFSS